MACPLSDAVSDGSEAQKKEQDATGAYNSADDSGDDLFNDIHGTQDKRKSWFKRRFSKD